MRKLKILAVTLCAGLLLTGCALEQRENMHTATYFDLFDTVTTIKGAGTEDFFQEQARSIHEKLTYYHKLFDIYEEYPGMNNLKTVNDRAGKEPVQVERPIIDLLLFCKEVYEDTDGRVNVAMGSVLSLWHDARERAKNGPAILPAERVLQMASHHMEFSKVIIDEEDSTVFLQDPQMRLDVGAVAKGWSTQQVAAQMPANMMLSVGGNVCITGPKNQDGKPWVVGIQDPRGEGYLQTIALTKGSVVTSGDYERGFQLDGINYHHIIDSETLHPSQCWSSVTVVCDDSAAADALSTALFMLPQQEGQKLLDRYGACAMWIDPDGEIFYSPGFEELLT